MIRFDMETGNLFPTELGRIASYFYIAYTTVEIINEKLFDSSTLLTILTIIAMSQVNSFIHLLLLGICFYQST